MVEEIDRRSQADLHKRTCGRTGTGRTDADSMKQTLTYQFPAYMQNRTLNIFLGHLTYASYLGGKK